MTTPHVAVPKEIALELAAVGRFASERGWVPATSGNFSRRIDAAHAAITRSGLDKGTIGLDDVIGVPLAGPLPSGISAEAPLHLARYAACADVGAVFHVHTLAATVLSRLDAPRGEVLLEGYEMHKALRGVTTHEGVVRIPIFENAQDTLALARVVEQRLAGERGVPAYLLAGHGFYVWGATMNEACRHLEGVEFLLRCALEERRLRS